MAAQPIERLREVEAELLQKGYKIPILTQVRSIERMPHTFPSAHELSIPTALTVGFSHERFSLKSILSRIKGEGADTQRNSQTGLPVQFENIWRWMVGK